MKNLRIVLIALSILIFGSTTSNAQYNPDHFDIHQNTVVAVNGLKLRTKPGLNGKVIGKIPFGEKVEVLTEHHFGRDTLESAYEIFYGNNESYKPVLSGAWAKVRYDGQDGYVFSAYLYYHFDVEETYNSRTALLFEGSNCYDNLHYRPDWHWYGLFENGTTHELRKVTLDLFVEETELGPMLNITTNQREAAIYIVGSPRPMTEKRLFFSEYMGQGSFLFMGKELDEELLAKSALHINQPENDIPRLFALGENGQRQLLNPEEAYLGYPSSVMWYGDLDGDGNMDYIIQYGEKTAHTILYLSSKAREGQLVAPVGAYYSGYCC